MLTNDDERPDEDLDGDEAVEMSKDMAKALAAETDEDEDDSDDQDDDAESDEGDGDEADDQRGGRGKQTAQDRIKELAKLRRDAEKAAFELEMKNIELERRLAERADSTDKAPKAPAPKDFTYGEVDPDYLAAVVDYKVALREESIRADAAKTARIAAEDKANEHYGRRLAEVMATGKQRFKDFDEVVGSTSYPADLARLILDSENAVDIAYHLSNNVGDLRALTRANASERARAIGRMEGRFSATSAAKKKTTSAPEALGSRQSRESHKTDGRFGPDSQDDFDKAFFSR